MAPEPNDVVWFSEPPERIELFRRPVWAPGWKGLQSRKPPRKGDELWTDLLVLAALITFWIGLVLSIRF